MNKKEKNIFEKGEINANFFSFEEKNIKAPTKNQKINQKTKLKGTKNAEIIAEIVEEKRPSFSQSGLLNNPLRMK